VVTGLKLGADVVGTTGGVGLKVGADVGNVGDCVVPKHAELQVDCALHHADPVPQ